MSTFIVLCTFDQAEPDALLGEQALRARVRRLLDDVGARLEHMWLCTGQYDLVVVVDAENVRDALAFLIAFRSRARVRTTTLAAAADDDISELVSTAQQGHSNWGVDI